MRKIILTLIIAICMINGSAFAYWVWTPESGKWENPKYAAKDTPQEQLDYAVSFYKEHNYKMCLREFKKLIKYYALSKQAPTAQYYIGRIMEDLGSPYEAFKAYQKVIDLYPYTESVDEVIEREFKIGDAFFSGKKLKILGPWKISANDKAIEIFKTVADNAPYGKYADAAIFKAGLLYKKILDYDNAVMMFKKLIDDYPDTKFIDKARYQLAECSKRMSLKSDYDQTPTIVARKEFEDFVEKHPESSMSGEARKIILKLKNREAENAYNIAKFYESRDIPESAVIYYRDIVQKYPDTEWAKKAQGRLNELQKK